VNSVSQIAKKNNNKRKLPEEQVSQSKKIKKGSKKTLTASSIETNECFL